MALVEMPAYKLYNFDILSMTKDTKYNVGFLTKHSTNRPFCTKYPKYY